MNLEQLQKRLDWLEDERRKDKLALATLEERLANLEGTTGGLPQQIKELDSNLTRINTILGRMDQIEANILQVRVEATRNLESVEKARSEKERGVEKAYRSDLENVNKAIADLSKSIESITEIKKNIQARVEEDYRLSRLIEELEQKILGYQRADDEIKRTLRLLDESSKQENKRVVDLQAEVNAIRKRLDEQRGKLDLTGENLRKVELRVSEIQAAEGERRQVQSTFLEKQSLWQFDRDRAWKEMVTKFSETSKMAEGLEVQIQSLDATQRAVKRAQEAFDEISMRFDRRINEISEMQRLVEDRFRQEWVSFKADVQKRWTNFSLTEEEQARDLARTNEKINERLVMLEDLTQELRDQIQLSIEETDKRLKSLVTIAHQWIDEYERVFGRSS